MGKRRFRVDRKKEIGVWDMVCRPVTHRDIGKDNISSKWMTGETEQETVQGRKM